MFSCMNVIDTYITENWKDEDFFTLIFFSLDVNDILITENWRGKNVFVLIFCLDVNDIFLL